MRTGSVVTGWRFPPPARADSVMILKVEPGRLGRGDGEAGQREHRAVARAHDGHAAELAPERRRGGALQPGPDRRVDRAPGAPPTGPTTRSPKRSWAPGRAGQPRVVLTLEAGPAVAPRRRAPGERRGRGLPASGGRRRRAPRRGGPRQHDAAHLLAGAQPWQPQVRRPRDARRAVLGVHGQHDRAAQRPEDAGGHGDGHREAAAAGLRDPPDANALHRGRALGRTYEAHEARPRIGCAAALVEQEPHPGRVAARPGGGEALRATPGACRRRDDGPGRTTPPRRSPRPARGPRGRRARAPRRARGAGGGQAPATPRRSAAAEPRRTWSGGDDGAQSSVYRARRRDALRPVGAT